MPLTTADFDGSGAFGPDLVLQVVNQVLAGAPFARSLDPLSSNSGQVAFPLVGPDGGDWVAEGQPLPEVDVNPDTYVSQVVKLAGIFALTNEALADARLDLGNQIGQAVADSLGPKLDAGILSGTGTGPSPIGVLTVAPDLGSHSLWDGIFEAVGQIGDAGGTATSVGVRPSTLAAEAGRVDSQGRPIHPSGLVDINGVRLVGVPTLAASQAVVFDASTVRLVVRSDFAIERSDEALFERDQVAVRVKGRFAAAVPSPEKSLRRFTIGAAGRKAA